MERGVEAAKWATPAAIGSDECDTRKPYSKRSVSTPSIVELVVCEECENRMRLLQHDIFKQAQAQLQSQDLGATSSQSRSEQAIHHIYYKHPQQAILTPVGLKQE